MSLWYRKVQTIPTNADGRGLSPADKQIDNDDGGVYPAAIIYNLAQILGKNISSKK
jgi:hypothetical protein